VTFYPISRSRHFWKSNVVQTKLVLPDRKLYPAYWMVVCLVTLTDLQTHRAGLSASAELLVACEWHTGLMQYCIVRSTESVDCGSTTYIYFRSFHNAKPVPPDAKSLWRHCAWKLIIPQIWSTIATTVCRHLFHSETATSKTLQLVCCCRFRLAVNLQCKFVVKAPVKISPH